MAGFKFKYCSKCSKTTTQAVQTYPDGTVIVECLECSNKELVKQGNNYHSLEQFANEETNIPSVSR